jgi:hypothetical protein
MKKKRASQLKAFFLAFMALFLFHDKKKSSQSLFKVLQLDTGPDEPSFYFLSCV